MAGIPYRKNVGPFSFSTVVANHSSRYHCPIRRLPRLPRRRLLPFRHRPSSPMRSTYLSYRASKTTPPSWYALCLCRRRIFREWSLTAHAGKAVSCWSLWCRVVYWVVYFGRRMLGEAYVRSGRGGCVVSDMPRTIGCAQRGVDDVVGGG
jgi:hypothetical protein